MKNFILGCCLFSIGVMTLLCIFMLEQKTIRKQEMQTGLPQAMESAALQQTEQTNELFLADMVENVVLSLQSDSDVTINVMGIDGIKGEASLNIKEKFQNVLGKSSEVTTQKTVICNQIQQPETKFYTIHFYLSKADLKKQTNCYKSYNIKEQETIIAPQEPKLQGKGFTSWVDANDYEADFSQPVVQNMDFYAQWE